MPFEDGIGLQRDGVSAKPQFIHGGDGWLLYNLIMNFAQRAQTGGQGLPLGHGHGKASMFVRAGPRAIIITTASTFSSAWSFGR